MEKCARQSEILFIWDAKMCNPNGDMAADNAPRFDDVDEKAIVSDVRIKRTIRDDLQYRKNHLIFINNEEILKKSLKAEERFTQLKKLSKNEKKDDNDKEVFLACIDNRIFGGVAPKSIQLIGPVQFSWTKSLNRTETVLKSGTGAFATKGKDGETKYTKTFRADNYIPYDNFAMYGTINRIQAERTGASENDAKEMFDSLWYGTKFLNTRSKEGQKPRMLFRIVYTKESRYFIGLIDELVKLDNDDSSLIRNINEVAINFDDLAAAIKKADKQIEYIDIVMDASMDRYKDKLKDMLDNGRIRFLDEFNISDNNKDTKGKS